MTKRNKRTHRKKHSEEQTSSGRVEEHAVAPNGGSSAVAAAETVRDAAGTAEETGTASAGEPSAEEKLAALSEKYLRLMAEYDNFRKRTAREKDEIIKTASEELIKELLPILDNLDRATEHKNNKQTLEEYVKGIALIEEQLRAVLSRAGLEAMDVVGKPFDPAVHDAVMQIESDEYEPGIVTDVVEKGYVLSGKVIRHPKVVVSK